ncbi:MAG: hypothetical protein GY898_11855 [Proteobacteria bacterium]|nr:hypothetical protein [Pseudomonadota bacterium]
MRLQILAAVAAPFLLLAGAAVAAEPADYAGTWNLVAADYDTPRDAAIDEVTAEMSALIRGITRKRLRKAATYSSHYVMTPGDGTMTISSDRSEGWTTPLDGTEVAMISDRGEDIHLSRRMKNGSLHSKARSERGAQSVSFELSADGARLTVTTTIVNDNLPRPVVYATEYARAR